jgi:hypothetical protein
MKQTLKIFLCITLMIVTAYSQQQRAEGSIIKQIVQQEAVEPIALPGSHFLKESFERVRKYFDDHPEQRGLKKSLADATEYEVGDSRTWWVSDFTEQSHKMPQGFTR